MPPPLTEKDIPIGTRSGRLVTYSIPFLSDDPIGSRESKIYVHCDCGPEVIFAVKAKYFRRGMIKSCGCLKIEMAVARLPSMLRYGERHHAYNGKKAWYAAEKADPCMDCGRSYPAEMMEFDHLGDKEFLLNTANLHRRTLNELKKERVKCDLVCVACHRIRTMRRREEKRAAMIPALTAGASEVN